MHLKLYKYQANGNDFIIYDDAMNENLSRGKLLLLAKKICQRRFSLGADGLIFISKNDGKYTFKIFEPDGSESDMCGNGLRCVAAYLENKTSDERFTFVTNSGEYSVSKQDDYFKVDMGAMKSLRKYFTLAKNNDKLISFSGLDNEITNILNEFMLKVENVYLVNSGEPHLIIFCERVQRYNLKLIGEKLNSRKDLFPFGVNVNLVEVVDEKKIINRTYERGVFEETSSCGTGSTAAAFVTRSVFNLTKSKITVITKGGKLFIQFNSDKVFLSGPAEKVYYTEVEI